jgi:hypothetical protein
MSVEKIKKLETLVAVIVEGVKGLHEENIRLENRLRELEQEKKRMIAENKIAKETLGTRRQLEASHRKLEKERSAVRLKVKNALQKIEKMDFV